jgi:hypothetical protein
MASPLSPPSTVSHKEGSVTVTISANKSGVIYERKETTRSRNRSENSQQDNILRYYEQLSNHLEDLDVKLNGVIARHEKDFLSAFKTLMHQVQKEMKELRVKSDEQALMVQRDKVVKELQDSLEWFKSEALKLSDMYTKLKEEHEIIKRQNALVMEHNEFLELKIKGLKRKHNTLKGVYQRNMNELSYRETSYDQSPLSAQGKTRPMTSKVQVFVQYLRKNYDLNNEDIENDISDFYKELESSYNSSLEHYRKVIYRERKKCQQLTAEFSIKLVPKKDEESSIPDIKIMKNKPATTTMRTRSVIKSRNMKYPLLL